MLKKGLCFALAMLLSVSAFAEDNDEWIPEDSGPAYSRFSIGAELGGPAVFASAFINFRPYQYVAVTGGFGYFGVGAISDGTSNQDAGSLDVFVFPTYLSFIYGLSHSLEILAGVDIIVAESNLSGENAGVVSALTGNSVVPLAGIGYRYAPYQSGFFFKATAYVIIGAEASVTCINNNCTTETRSQVLPWAGLSFGYAFWSAEKESKEDEFDYDDDY